MSELITRTAKLIPKSKRIKPFPGFATAYHYELDAIEAHGLGNLYVVIEVLTNPKQAEAVADLVIETVGNTYYNTASDNQGILERFENALKTTNQALAAYTNSGNASWVGRMSALIAILSDHELHITQAGSAEAYLFRGNVTSHVTTDLNGKNQQHPINTFSNIATGEVQIHDRLIMATPAFFHQLQRPQLKAILGDNTANGAVQKFSELIKQDEDSNRIAAIVVEITTAELLSLQAIPDEPDDVEIGQTDKPIEVAKAFAAPMAQSIVKTSKAVGVKASEKAKNNIVPKIKDYGFNITTVVRNRLSTPKGKYQLGAGLLTILFVLAGASIINSNGKVASSKLNDYDKIYNQYATARDLLSRGDKSSARSQLMATSNNLTSLSKSVTQPAFDRQLSSRAHPEQDPAAISKLQASIRALIEQIDGVGNISFSLLTDFGQFKNAKPSKLIQAGNKIIVFDYQNNSAVYSYDLASKTLSILNKGNAQMGKVIATTLSSDGGSIYLLTDKPSVWLIKVFDGSLSEQSLNIGSWPKGRALSTYNGNLYILADDSSQIYKFSPTSAGFAAPQDYFKDESVTRGVTTLTIDGSIYLAGGRSGLRRFTSAKLDQTLTNIPSQLQKPSEIYSINNTDRLLTLDSVSGRIGIFNNNPDSITFEKQLTPAGVKSITGLATSAKSNTIYALTDGKLSTANLPQ
jgi:hypothetical protein